MGVKTYKRLSINLTEELDRAVLDMRKREEYVRCSYVEIIRVLMSVHSPTPGGEVKSIITSLLVKINRRFSWQN